MHGKPFKHPSAEQRAALGAAFKRDAIKLAKDVGFAAVQHLQDHPESVVTQTIVDVERSTGGITAISRGIATLLREREARAAQAAEAASEQARVDADVDVGASR